jgi:chromosome segregation ATPase
MNDYNKLSYDELVHKNLELRQIITTLRNQREEYEKCTARINPPNKSYKELEQKLAETEEKRQKDIDELWETRITPLQNEVKDKKIQLESAYKSSESQKDRIKALEMAVAALKSKIDYAIGYISATPYMRDKNPDEVKRWLFKEFE